MVLCLMFLTALTLLGLSASADTLLQRQLSANFLETQRANQSALAGQSWVESWLLNFHSPISEPCSSPCEELKIHIPDSLPEHPEWEDLSWWRDQGYEAGINPITGDRMVNISPNSSHPPIWVIEAVHQAPASDDASTPARSWYRILVRGSGRSDTAVAVVESVIARPWVTITTADTADSIITMNPNLTSICYDSTSTLPCGRVSWRQLR